MRQNVLHWPRLDTVLMVEQHIKENGGVSKKQLWRTLPKKVMYQTYCVIVDYLLETGKIAKDRQNNLCYIWDPESVRYWTARTDLAWQGESSSGIRRSRKHTRSLQKETLKTGNFMRTSKRQSNDSAQIHSAASRPRKDSSLKRTVRSRTSGN